MRKVGRPRKKYMPGERPTILSVAIPEGLSNAIPSSSNISREFTLFLQLRYGGKDKNEVDLEFIRNRIKELENQIAALRAQEELIIERMREEDEARKEVMFQQEALAFYLRRIFEGLARSFYEAKSIYYPKEVIADLERNVGITMTEAAFHSAIRNYDKLPSGNQLLIELGVKLLPGCQGRPYWKEILADYQKFLFMKKEASQ